MIKDLRKVQTRLDVMAIQLERMDDLTRKVDELSTSKTTHDLPKKPMSWATAARKQTNPSTIQPGSNYRLSEPQPPPPTKMINEFKPAQVIIRNINTEVMPFEDKSTSEITDCVNFALTTLDIKPVGASEPATVRSAIRLPNGDIKLYTPTRAEAKCILEHRHEWTELANTDFKTTRPGYPVVLHSVPQQDMFDDTLIEDLTSHNNLPEGTILGYRWLGNPASKHKSHGSMVVTLNDKEVAGKIARGGLFLHSMYLRGQTYHRSPLKCFPCLSDGHVAARCSITVPPKCLNCNGEHESCSCDLPRGPPRCFNCIKAERENNDGKEVDQEAAKFNHHITSTKCPLRQTLKRPNNHQQGKVITLSC